MQQKLKQLQFLSEFQKFITASSTGRRLMPSGKKVRTGTINQYRSVCTLLQEFEKSLDEPLRIQLLHRSGLRNILREKNYWSRFFKKFSQFLFKEKNCYDHYAGSVFKIIKTFFHYLSIERSMPVGDFHKKFRIPVERFNPVILTPAQLRFLITEKAFEQSLSPSLLRTKDIFVFGSVVALRFQDLMRLKKGNIQYSPEGISVVLHTQKTGSEVKIPLPDFAVAIIHKYRRKAGPYVLPRISGSNLNIQIKALIKKAGWDYTLPKIRHRQGEPVEIKNKYGEVCKFYDHITVHTMRRTAITTLLLMGVDESSVRRISGHAPGSKEFYRYVVVVQEYLNAKIKDAHAKLLQGSENTEQKIA
jgi:integrase